MHPQQPLASPPNCSLGTLRPWEPAPTPTALLPRSWGCWSWSAVPRRSWTALVRGGVVTPALVRRGPWSHQPWGGGRRGRGHTRPWSCPSWRPGLCALSELQVLLLANGVCPMDMSGVSAMPTGGITHTMGVGQCWGSSGCSCPHPKPRFCAAVRALRVICACAEGYYWAQEPAPEARPQPGAAAM